jgi:signal transduction histidine kinase
MTMQRVLIVDDREENLYLLRVLLEGNGYEVSAAANGGEALDVARQKSPDLIIADILMPVMDGFTLCREWKKDVRLRSIPFVFYTATYTDERDRQFALSLGAERFVAKPQEPDVFMEIVREVILEGGSPSAASAAPESDASTSAEAPSAAEPAYLQQYSEALVRKLEAKMEQLERVNRELEQDIAARQKAEAEVRRLNQTLEHRVAARTAQLEAANEELTAFAYSVSHDLRAPLRALDGFSRALLEDCADTLDEACQGHLEHIRKATREMSSLIDALLALSRVARAEVRHTEVNLSEAARRVAEELSASDLEREAEWRIEPDVIVSADAVLLQSVLENLLGNAWKFTSKHSRATIEVGTIDIDGERVIFVRDDGAGFDMQYAAKMFGAFQRLHSGEEFGGTGIGLATVKRIVDKHGGRIWAEGEPEQGATFYFTLA